MIQNIFPKANKRSLVTQFHIQFSVQFTVGNIKSLRNVFQNRKNPTRTQLSVCCQLLTMTS